MYINPKYIIFGMAVAILLLLIYIAYLLRAGIKPQVIIMDSTGKPMDNALANNNQRTIAPVSMPMASPAPNGQTDFFRKSSEYAIDYVMGRVQFQASTVPIHAQQVLTMVTSFNDIVKQNIITAIKFITIDTTSAIETERRMRLQMEQERIPLWIVLLRDATQKVVPYIDFSNNNFNPNYAGESKPVLTLVKNTA